MQTIEAWSASIQLGLSEALSPPTVVVVAIILGRAHPHPGAQFTQSSPPVIQTTSFLSLEPSSRREATSPRNHKITTTYYVKKSRRYKETANCCNWKCTEKEWQPFLPSLLQTPRFRLILASFLELHSSPRLVHPAVVITGENFLQVRISQNCIDCVHPGHVVRSIINSICCGGRRDW